MSLKAETLIVRACLAWVGKNRGRAWHVSGSILQPSEPDIDGYIWSVSLSRYIHLKIEIKTSTGVASERQKLRVAEYKNAGYVAGIATSLDEFINLIRDYEHEHSNQ